MLILESSDVLSKYPFERTATEETELLCPFRVLTTEPVFKFQIFTVLSSDPVAK